MPDNTTITQFTWALTIADYVTDQRLGRLLATAVERYLSPTAEHADLTASLVPNYLILGAQSIPFTECLWPLYRSSPTEKNAAACCSPQLCIAAVAILTSARRRPSTNNVLIAISALRDSERTTHAYCCAFDGHCNARSGALLARWQRQRKVDRSKLQTAARNGLTVASTPSLRRGNLNPAMLNFTFS